jgi:hypothetical protein
MGESMTQSNTDHRDYTMAALIQPNLILWFLNINTNTNTNRFQITSVPWTQNAEYFYSLEYPNLYTAQAILVITEQRNYNLRLIKTWKTHQRVIQQISNNLIILKKKKLEQCAPHHIKEKRNTKTALWV